MNLFLLTLAQATVSPSEIGLSNPATNPNSAIGNVLSIVYLWAGIICVITIIIAGIIYATSGGNASNTKRAREAIIYAIVGIVVIIMAFAITTFILERF